MLRWPTLSIWLRVHGLVKGWRWGRPTSLRKKSNAMQLLFAEPGDEMRMREGKGRGFFGWGEIRSHRNWRHSTVHSGKFQTKRPNSHTVTETESKKLVTPLENWSVHRGSCRGSGTLFRGGIRRCGSVPVVQPLCEARSGAHLFLLSRVSPRCVAGAQEAPKGGGYSTPHLFLTSKHRGRLAFARGQTFWRQAGAISKRRSFQLPSRAK